MSTIFAQPTASLGAMLGDGLVRPVFGPTASMTFAPAANYGSARWGGNKVIWAIAPDLRTQALVRGHQLDGPGAVGFTYGNMNLDDEPARELVVGQITPRDSSNSWRSVVTSTRVENPGCYAVQIDTTDRSDVLVFQVTCNRSGAAGPRPTGC